MGIGMLIQHFHTCWLSLFQGCTLSIYKVEVLDSVLIEGGDHIYRLDGGAPLKKKDIIVYYDLKRTHFFVFSLLFKGLSDSFV